MGAYFSNMRKITYNLALAGALLTDDDFIMNLLQGIHLKYNAIFTNIN